MCQYTLGQAGGDCLLKVKSTFFPRLGQYQYEIGPRKTRMAQYHLLHTHLYVISFAIIECHPSEIRPRCIQDGHNGPFQGKCSANIVILDCTYPYMPHWILIELPCAQSRKFVSITQSCVSIRWRCRRQRTVSSRSSQRCFFSKIGQISI